MSYNIVAYTVCEDADDDLGAVVVFASSWAVARRKGARQLGVEFSDSSCTRSPEFDSYSQAGKVPPLVMIYHGWRFECSHCGHELDSGAEGLDGEPLMLVEDGDLVYCSQAHMMAEWHEQTERRRGLNASIEACATMFHGLPIFGLRGNEAQRPGKREQVACCDFDFHGRSGLLARWYVGSEFAYVSPCDLSAWRNACGKGDSE